MAVSRGCVESGGLGVALTQNRRLTLQWDFRERKRDGIETGRPVLGRKMFRERLLQAPTCIFYFKHILSHISKMPSVVEKISIREEIPYGERRKIILHNFPHGE